MTTAPHGPLTQERSLDEFLATVPRDVVVMCVECGLGENRWAYRGRDGTWNWLDEVEARFAHPDPEFRRKAGLDLVKRGLMTPALRDRIMDIQAAVQ